MPAERASTAPRRRVLILGAPARFSHDFNVVFRDAPAYEVVGFTAAQIPNVAGRTYPPQLAGPLYPAGIPILPQKGWEDLVRPRGVDEVVFASSDVSHLDVMHVASRAVAAGPAFRLLGAGATMLTASRPVVSICAVRTGCGKSPLARFVAGVFRAAGLRVAVVRHPMPYGDLVEQAVQRFATLEDLERADCTIEEREEYEPHIAAGDLVFARGDYQRLPRAAESEAEHTPRPGHETTYFPGEANLVRADVVVLTKVDTADREDVRDVRENVRLVNPRATVVEMAMPLRADDEQTVRGKRVLVIEDGPTVTHGGMGYGAGLLAARRFGAAALVDPRPYAVGSIKPVFEAYPQLGPVLPAMGYGAEQIADLEATIEAGPCDLVVVASPVDLRRLRRLTKPAVRVSYEVEERGEPKLSPLLREFAARVKRG